MPVTDFKALCCQPHRQMAGDSEVHSWRRVRAALQEPPPAARQPPRRVRAPPRWPPPADSLPRDFRACPSLAGRGHLFARTPVPPEPGQDL